MASRKPISLLVQAQRERVDKITERIGQLMSKRVDEEKTLAELIAMEQGRTP